MRNLEGLKHWWALMFYQLPHFSLFSAYETKRLSDGEPAFVNGVNPVLICSSHLRAKQILPLEIIPLSDLGLNRNEIL
jgi:hypothetical protein